MKCLICGIDFNNDMAERACKNCSIFGSCRMVKCPFCGYENVPNKKNKNSKNCSINKKKLKRLNKSK
ncbi:MAG: hypothetical protein ACFFDF_16755 [Candidatus Odinarchaeota archaeon]